MSDGPVLETARLRLRWFTADDAPLMYAVWNSPGFLQHVGDRGIDTVAAASDALTHGALRSYADTGYGPFRVGLKDDTGIGICGLFRRDEFDDPDLGFALLPEWYRHGYAYEAGLAVLRYCDQQLLLPRVIAIVSPGNVPSIQLIRKLGMRRAGQCNMQGDAVDVYERRRPRAH